MEDERETISLRRRLKKSSMNLSVCFNGGHSFDNFDSSDQKVSPRRSPLPSPIWTKSRCHEFPEIKGKCRNLISRMARHRRHSADFSYDPLSYALNFDEGSASEDVRFEEFPMRNFSSRLPSSPPRIRSEKFRNSAPPTPKAAILAPRSVTPPPIKVEMLRSIDERSPMMMPRAEIEAAVTTLKSRSEAEEIVTPATATAVMSRREVIAFS